MCCISTWQVLGWVGWAGVSYFIATSVSTNVSINQLELLAQSDQQLPFLLSQQPLLPKMLFVLLFQLPITFHLCLNSTSGNNMGKRADNFIQAARMKAALVGGTNSTQTQISREGFLRAWLREACRQFITFCHTCALPTPLFCILNKSIKPSQVRSWPNMPYMYAKSKCPLKGKTFILEGAKIPFSCLFVHSFQITLPYTC